MIYTGKSGPAQNAVHIEKNDFFTEKNIMETNLRNQSFGKNLPFLIEKNVKKCELKRSPCFIF